MRNPSIKQFDICKTAAYQSERVDVSASDPFYDFGTSPYEIALYYTDDLGISRAIYIEGKLFDALHVYLETLEYEIKGDYVDRANGQGCDYVSGTNVEWMDLLTGDYEPEQGTIIDHIFIFLYRHKKEVKKANKERVKSLIK